MTVVDDDRIYLAIKACKEGKMVYRHEAYDTVTTLELWRPENREVWFECTRNEPAEVLGVKLCHPPGNPFVQLEG